MSVTNIITRSARQLMAKQPRREVISLTEAISAPVYYCDIVNKCENEDGR